MTEPRKMDIEAIMHLLPHRYPFLLVDRVLDVQSGQYVRAIKNVTFNEPFFTGHFPHRPVMPGVLMLEAMAAMNVRCLEGVDPASLKTVSYDGRSA